MTEKAYLTREDVLKILKINDEELDALIREGKLQEKEEGKFSEEDIIMYATEYPPELEEEMKILPSLEEPVEEKAEEKEEVPPLIEEPAAEEKAEEVEEPLPPVTEELRIEPVEPKAEVKAEPEVKPQTQAVEEPALFETPELAVSEKSIFFTFLFLLSIIIILASAGILVLPILGIPIPEFIKPAVNFVSGLF